jgi:hypothetical protein
MGVAAYQLTQTLPASLQSNLPAAKALEEELSTTDTH